MELCFRFSVLNAARSGEARNAAWDEIEFNTCEWRIPASRMTAASEHRVPLSEANGSADACAWRARLDRGQLDRCEFV